MASHSVAKTKHAVLTADTADDVTLTSTVGLVRITNRAGAGELYVRVDGTAPAVGADESYVVLPGQTRPFNMSGAADQVVGVIASLPLAYSVEAD